MTWTKRRPLEQTEYDPAQTRHRQRCSDNRQTARYQKRGTDSLQRSSDYQGAGTGRNAAPDRGGCKPKNADQKDSLAPELVAQRSADEDQRAEEERVGFDHPLDIGDRRA